MENLDIILIIIINMDKYWSKFGKFIKCDFTPKIRKKSENKIRTAIHIGRMARNAYIRVGWYEGDLRLPCVGTSDERVLFSVALYTFGSRSAGTVSRIREIDHPPMPDHPPFANCAK